ncbi:hypothetical protein KDD17_00455 [Sulfitobacter albidus]|uniref:Uncharacterized protein n=1 Tax=Sulfitobacter albidus TaxID=2829501 RepID=A0A975JE42_9RHOB|nr:hypothetical protein [Sulfitobacter albidus]QUJ76585.1 hypothetical protein KDD17_00455 [Sulfitobacter albidus]
MAREIQEKLLRGLADFASRAWMVMPGQGIVIRRTMQATRRAYDSWQDTMRRVGFDKTALEAGAEPIDDAARALARRTPELFKEWYDDILRQLPEESARHMRASEGYYLNNVLPSFSSKPEVIPLTGDGALFRVIDKPDGHTGGFWSRNIPDDDEAVWRSRNAVLQGWNEGGAFIKATVPPPPAALRGPIAPQISEADPNMMLRGGDEQIFLPGPREGAIGEDQVTDYWHTGWNDRAPTSPSRASMRAGNPNECDK